MPLSKNDPQGYGSALTYARRYSIASMIGLITEDDDDAEAACGRGKQNFNNHQNGKGPFSACAAYPQPGNGHGSKASNDDDLSLLSNLPQLNGVSYQSITANDGQICVVATGDTMRQKDRLKGNGFKWNPQRKVWWRYAEDV